MWEDDQAACVVRPDNSNFFQDAVTATALIARGVTAIRAAGPPNYGILAGIAGEVGTFVQGDDELIGLLVDKDSTSYAGTNPGTTHMVYDHSTLNGRAILTLKRSNRSADVTGRSDVAVNSTFDWTAGVGGSSGTVTYVWSINGDVVQSGTSDVVSYQNNGVQLCRLRDGDRFSRRHRISVPVCDRIRVWL